MNIILIAKPLRENTNTKANALNNGWARSGSEEFKKFSHFVGVDKGIVRTNVLTGKKLSDKIRKEVGSGDSKLGKGGYFSTGDVLLGKDVVSYTVQVFSENNERVGVNTQSHRVQYNLPILADFSVIQDTVEPSRTVVEKIIPKLNIPEEEKGKTTTEDKEDRVITRKTTYTLVATPANAYQKTVQQLTITTVRMLRKQWFPKQQPLLRRRL